MKRNNFFKAKFGILVGATLAFVVVGCAKDQTLDEYHENQVQQDLTQMNMAAGTYTGTLTNTNTNQSIGNLEIDLNTQLTPTPNSNNTENTTSAGLVGKAILSTSTNPQSIAPISNASYNVFNNSSSGTFSGTITSTLSDSSTVSVQITGTISGNTFTGSFTSSNNVLKNTSFTLTKSNVAAGTAQLGNGHQPSLSSTLHTYKGSYAGQNLGSTFFPDPSKVKTQSPASSQQTVFLVIDESSNTSSQNFINAISFQPLLTVSMNTQDPSAPAGSAATANNSNTSFENVSLDEISGVFTALQTVSIGTGENCTEKLRCTQGGTYNASAPWTCDYTDTCGSPISFTASPQN
jgi:hypothetical protein